MPFIDLMSRADVIQSNTVSYLSPNPVGLIWVSFGPRQAKEK